MPRKSHILVGKENGKNTNPFLLLGGHLSRMTSSHVGFLVYVKR